MCVVSMISDHWQKKWSDPSKVEITFEQWQEYLELKRKAEEYDKKTNQPKCQKPDLEIWEKLIEEVLRKKKIIK